MSCIKRYLEELAAAKAEEEGIDEYAAMQKILEEANQGTDRKEDEEKNAQMKLAYTKIDQHLREIKKLMKRYDIHEFNSKITADDKVVFTAAFKRV